MTSTLNAELPNDMIIDGSMLDISTVIGQGVCINSIHTRILYRTIVSYT